jgi:P-type Ca2+ transporter type 2C
MVAILEEEHKTVAPGGETWHTLEAGQALERLEVQPASGLDDEQVAERLERYGPNELVETGIKNPLLILWEQLTDPLVVILLAAAVVSAFLGETKSVIAIMAIVVLNAMLGVSQEYRAERAMAALKKMSAPAVRVRRGGRVLDISPRDLVPGDIVLLETGSILPADGRVIEAVNLRVQEASLTGESHAVDKYSRTLNRADAPLGDRMNMVYMGTAVTYGRGAAVVVNTGMSTELGRIATLIQTVEHERTPLQRRMAELGRALFVLAVIIVIIAFILGMAQGGEINVVFLAAVAIAVAVVPEGLPAVLTISLALGAQRMLRRRALIRKLTAVETLGSVTVICSDKTGTLTENRMTVKVISVDGYTHDITDIIQRSKHLLIADSGDKVDPTSGESLLLAAGALCNDASLERAEDDRPELVAYGDPTEGALLVAAGHFDIWKSHLETALPRVGEVPFTSERKRMTTLHHLEPVSRGEYDEGVQQVQAVLLGEGYRYAAFTKGAVDSLMSVCGRVWLDGHIVPMTAEIRERILAANDQLARDGLRVLGAAFKPLRALPETIDIASTEHDLVFTGMFGMIDPPRLEVKDAVERCRSAGIRPVMITGDHPLTALSIAKELELAADERILTGADLEKMSIEALEDVVEEVSVYARVSPEHKLNIVQALQRRGHVVAMTGDGVNDAPALKRSDIGVAMGITGTPVSKEASEMVMLDDNFATIVSAVEEGRTIYDNVRKFIKYIMASNTGEVGVLFITQLMGMPLPLNTLQILWMNLVTDGLPALALGVEKGEPNAMKRPPYSPTESIFSRGLGAYLARIGFLICAISMLVVLLVPDTDPAWNTMIFTTLVISQMGHALAIRSEHDSTFKLGLFSNKTMLFSIGLTVGLQLVLIYWPVAQDFFGTVALSAGQLAICMGLSLITFFGVELDKWYFQRRRKARA